MKKVVLLLIGLCLLGGARLYQVLAPKAEIVVQGMSPQEIHDLGWHTAPSTGLKVVGKGELVYLSGREAAGEAGTAYSWTLTPPAGSTATLDSTTTAWTTFRPDVKGQYRVSLDLTTASGTSSASLTITAAEYVSVGQVNGKLFPDARKGQCAACHSGQYENWSKTGHADFFKRAIDGLASDHYGENCISCHVNGFNTEPQADNGGFDDLARMLNWRFPETLQPGNWDNLVNNYPDLARSANIQCESCHGPGSEHKGDLTGTEVSLNESVCGRCHEEEPYHRISTQWKSSGHGTGTSFAYAGGRSGCADCHSGYGFIAKFDPQSNLSQKTGGADGVACAVCHDPHGGKYEHQLRRIEDVTLPNRAVVSWGGDGRLCMNCHMGRRDAESYAVPANASGTFGPHHSNQTDMLAGTNAITFGYYIPSSTHRNALDDSCVDCHMAPTPATGVAGHDELGGHSWGMKAEVNGQEVDFVQPCQRCHGSIASFNDIEAREDYDGDKTVESAKEELHGLLDVVGNLLPPEGPGVVTTKDFTPLQMKAAFNFFFVEDDASEGMHNFQYAIGLLKVTRDVLRYGVLTAGEIDRVKDVPNDQGGQVTVSWTRFGGDGPSDDPVQTYYVWRKVDGTAAAAKNTLMLRSLDAVSLDASQAVGATVAFSDGLWTVVGSQPAARMERYAAVVPTLYDSTASGLRYSVYRVSGHTAINGIYAVSAPDSSYSIDNLVPSAPAGVAARVANGGVVLSWNELPDPDIDYVAVYRSAVPEFDVASMEPLAKISGTEYTDLAVNPGQSYYYKLAAYDFSGNQGRACAQVEARVATGVESLAGGIPTTYTLEQNYPNPFNPSTSIAFGIPEAGQVRITVYDISGKEIGVVVDQYMAAGRYQASWTADQLASGVYLYRIQCGTFTQARTMMLLK